MYDFSALISHASILLILLVWSRAKALIRIKRSPGDSMYIEMLRNTKFLAPASPPPPSELEPLGVEPGKLYFKQPSQAILMIRQFWLPFPYACFSPLPGDQLLNIMYICLSFSL